MKCNKRLKYNNYVAFSHFHGTAVNNSGLASVDVTYIRHPNQKQIKIKKERELYEKEFKKFGAVVNRMSFSWL